jgi:hypothetical protein
LKALPALKIGVLLAANFMVLPVAGLRPVRASRCLQGIIAGNRRFYKGYITLLRLSCGGFFLQ